MKKINYLRVGKCEKHKWKDCPTWKDGKRIKSNIQQCKKCLATRVKDVGSKNG